MSAPAVTECTKKADIVPLIRVSPLNPKSVTNIIRAAGRCELLFFLILDMIWLYYILIVIATFLIMEGITWATHKWVMHGFLWYLHRDHHQVEPGFFEKNDAFFVIFAVPSMLCIYFGTIDKIWWLQAIGFGIMAYGFAYFLVHDVIIHQRFKWFSRSRNTYVRAIRWAHKMHHKHLNKQEGESFGMLYVHKKYWDKVRRDSKLMAGRKVEYAPELE